MDAHAQLDALVRWHGGIALAHAALNLNSAARGVHGAGKLDQDAVASPLDNTAAVLGDRRLEEFEPVGIKPRERSFLVGPH